MNEQDLMNAVGEIGEDLIDESERKRHDRFRRIAFLAACTALIIVLGWRLIPQERSAEIQFTEVNASVSMSKLPYPEGAYERAMTEPELAAFLGIESFTEWNDEIPSGYVHHMADGTVWKVDIQVGEGSEWLRMELTPGEVPKSDFILVSQVQPQDYCGVKLRAICCGEYREAWGLVEGAEIIGVRITALGQQAEERISRYAELTIGRNEELSLSALDHE